MTIDQALQRVALLLFLGFGLALFIGYHQLSLARRLPYFILRRERMSQGWRWVGVGILLAAAAVLVVLFGRPIAYRIVPPTPSMTPTATITLTPTITTSPTITSTPTITLTPSISPTPTQTATPALPEAISVLIRETVTPLPEAAFSPIEVATRLDRLNRPIDPGEELKNPLRRLYGAFTYNNLSDGVRWTAIWYRSDIVVCLETQAWDGGTGGYGYTECEPGQWLPGEYEIQMFIGESWMVSKRFTVVGDPPTPTPEPTPTNTHTATASPTWTASPSPSNTASPSASPAP